MQPFKRERLWSLKLNIFILARRSLWQSTYPVFAPSQSWWPSHPPAPVCKTQRQEGLKKKKGITDTTLCTSDKPSPSTSDVSTEKSVPASIMITLTSPWLTVSPSCSWTLPSPGCPGSAPSAPPIGQSTTWWHMTFGSCTSRQCWLHSKAAHREEIMKQT